MDCSVGGCGNQVFRKGWCSSHWHRWQRYGTPTGGGTYNGEATKYLADVVFATADEVNCLLWPYAKDRCGYGQHEKHTSVSRTVCERRHGPPPTEAHQAAHSCGKGHLGCVNPHHISWKTPAENQADRVRHGTANCGPKIGPNQAMVIRALAPTRPKRELADLFGISVSLVCKVVANKARVRA